MSYISKNGKGKIFSLLFLFIISCNSSKEIVIKKVEKNEVENYYVKNNIKIDNVLFLKNFEEYKKLDSIEFTTIPDIFIFDKKGNYISVDGSQKGECINEPILFLENIESKNLNFSNKINLNDYFSCFNINNDINKMIINSKSEYFVFINSATFTDNLNQIRFEDSKKINSQKCKVFFVNLDLLKEWFN